MFDTNNLQQIQNNAGLTAPQTNLGMKPFQFVGVALPYIYGVAGIVLLLNIISSGLKMMTSQGDPKAIGAAQAKLTTSAIGILILFASFWIVQLLMSFLGFDTVLFVN